MAQAFEDLVAAPEFAGVGRQEMRHLVRRKALHPADCISSDDISQAIRECRLHFPYLQMVRHSTPVPAEKLTFSARTSGGERFGFVDADKVAKALAEGRTMKLNQVEHWHRPTAAQAAILADRFPVEVKTFVFLTPAEETGLLPHRDASHVLVLHLEGHKEWTLWNPGPQTRSSHGLDVDLENPLARLVLEPGDVMYLPHGYPHSARAVDGPSLHLTFTLSLPTPEALVAVLRAAAGPAADETPSTPAPPRDRHQLVDAAAQDLLRSAAGLDAGHWFDAALAWQRHGTLTRGESM
jgi:ribosomal protein L16 Arg81 hydroxylase